ncbi:MAG: hypothetical protein ACSLFI_00020 [Solirubrobacterales bacterium]
MDSAQTSFRRLPDRRYLLTIRHAPLTRVKPPMLAWWSANIEGEIELDGKKYPRYLIWHLYDHIYYSCTRLADGSVGPGVRFMIVGVPGTLGRLVNPLITRRLFSERHGQAWLRHNIEEVGLLDHLVPRLYAERDR